MTVRVKVVGGPLEGPPLLIATMHGKEAVLAPRLATLGFRVLLPVGYDTDTLGTFSGDVRRPGTAFEAALEKARRACAATGVSRAVSSEGSYRPSSSAFEGAVNAELLAFVDQEAGIELVEHVTNVPTRFAMGRVPPDLRAPQVAALLERIGWPAVRAIVVAGDPGAGVPAWPVYKGIGTEADLAEALSVCASLSDDGLAHLETDLRAHMNPTRMAVIAQLADRLVARLQRDGYGLDRTRQDSHAAG
jgi:hypothetical protein